MKVAVVGAGVVGLCCASHLQAQGHAVTLIDPRPPGEYCSYGNAGCFSRCSCVPLGLPGIWKQVPAWLLDPVGPLHIPLRHALRIAPWLWRFQQAASMARVERIADALHALLTVTLDKWRPLAERMALMVVGGPERVAANLQQIIDATQADELIIASDAYKREDRLRSYEIISESRKLVSGTSFR